MSVAGEDVHLAAEAALDDTLRSMRDSLAVIVARCGGRSEAIDLLLEEIGLCGDLERINTLLGKLDIEIDGALQKQRKVPDQARRAVVRTLLRL